MMKNAMSATLVALLSSQQAEARDFDIRNELTKALNGLISSPKIAAIDSLKQVLAAAPDSDDEADEVIDLDASDANESHTLTSSNTVQFKVKDKTGSTGYSWIVDSSNCGARLMQTDVQYNAPPEGLMGASGERIWTFETPSADENYIRGLPCDMQFFE